MFQLFKPKRKTDVRPSELEQYIESLSVINSDLYNTLNTLKAEVALLQEESEILENILTMINEIISTITRRNESIDNIFDTVLRSIGTTYKVTQTWLCQVIYKDNKITCLFLNTQGKNPYNLTKGLMFDSEEAGGRYEKVFQRGEYVVLNPINNQTEEESFFNMWGNKTLVLIPILNDGILWGVIGLSYFNNVRTFNMKERIGFRLITKLLSVFISIRNHLKDLSERKVILNKLSTAIMIYTWKKDNYGRYTYVDKKWMDLFYPDFFKTKPLIGETDMSAIMDFRKKPGNIHTFGELCLGSDQICINEQRTIHFLEVGNINGKELILHVVKQPSFTENNEYKDIIGIAHNITFLGLQKFKELTEKMLMDGDLIIIKESWVPLILVYQFKDELFGKNNLFSWYQFNNE